MSAGSGLTVPMPIDSADAARPHRTLSADLRLRGTANMQCRTTKHLLFSPPSILLLTLIFVPKKKESFFSSHKPCRCSPNAFANLDIRMQRLAVGSSLCAKFSKCKVVEGASRHHLSQAVCRRLQEGSRLDQRLCTRRESCIARSLLKPRLFRQYFLCLN